jgi:hypothetical protein
MNPELLHMAAQRHYQERLRAAQRERRVERVPGPGTSKLGQAILNMRMRRRRRALAIGRAAVGAA